MERVDVKTGFNCNNRCRFCVQGDKRDLYGNKDTDEVKKVLEAARLHLEAGLTGDWRDWQLIVDGTRCEGTSQ